ncbi:hypothetical protein PSPO01_07936 [Paraphaeosphaeria sporulosa]
MAKEAPVPLAAACPSFQRFLVGLADDAYVPQAMTAAGPWGLEKNDISLRGWASCVGRRRSHVAFESHSALVERPRSPRSSRTEEEGICPGPRYVDGLWWCSSAPAISAQPRRSACAAVHRSTAQHSAPPHSAHAALRKCGKQKRALCYEKTRGSGRVAVYQLAVLWSGRRGVLALGIAILPGAASLSATRKPVLGSLAQRIKRALGATSCDNSPASEARWKRKNLRARSREDRGRKSNARRMSWHGCLCWERTRKGMPWEVKVLLCSVGWGG